MFLTQNFTFANNFIRQFINMLEEIYEGRNKFAHKVYIFVLMLIVLIIVPLQQLRKLFDYHRVYNKFISILSEGPSVQRSQLEISEFYPIISRNPFIGKWESSIKRSQYLHEQSGKVQIRALYNHTQNFNNYDLNIKIFDGQFLDNRYYDITINSGSIKVKQRFQSGKILYQTISPLISYCRQGVGLKLNSQKALYINKLKFKIIADFYPDSTQIKALKLQILISSQYSINVIGREIQEYNETIHDIILAVLLFIQFVTQGYGLYHLSEGIISQKQCSQRFSKMGFLFSTAFDMTQAVGLTFIGFLSTKRMAVFSLPVLILWVIIVVIQLRVLTILFHQQFKQNALKFSAKVYVIFSLFCFISYLFNLHHFYFVLLCLMAMSPQIYNNYMVGHKLKQNMKYFLIYILPRYCCIPYLRFYKYNVFGFEPNWSLFIVCMIILSIQITLIMVQIRYGVRSIVPRFFHPEELKYFLSEPDSQDDSCSICLVSLKQKGFMENIQFSQMKAIRGQQFCNNIVLTPCRHKFHIQCLANSMKNKLNCPNCRAILPPLDQYQ